MHTATFLKETAEIAAAIDPEEIEGMAKALSEVKGRVYMVGLGGSLANCIHMAADLRKLCDIDAVAPNIAELTAWANDSGWYNAFQGYLEGMTKGDALFILSVGGGTTAVSACISQAIGMAMRYEKEAKIFGIVGPDGGDTRLYGDYVIHIPVDNAKHITPHTEAFQAVIWHCLVSHPLLQKRPTKW